MLIMSNCFLTPVKSAYGWPQSGILQGKQDLQDWLDLFFHHFPDESDEEQPAFGGWGRGSVNLAQA